MRRPFAVVLLLLSFTFVAAPTARVFSQTPAAPSGPPSAPVPAQTPSQQPATVQGTGTPAASGEPGTLPEQTAPPTRRDGTATAAQAPAPPHHATSTPYTGDLSIFEDPHRDQLLQTGRVLDTLHLQPGSAVADIGAGGGWFTVRAARRVGPNGRVFAEDINPHAVDTIRDRAAREHLADVTPVLGTPDDPHLTPDSLNAAVMLRVYHEVAHTDVLLPHVRAALKPHGLIAVIDHPGNGADHGINPDVVKAEVEHAGLRYVAQYDFTKGDQNDYMLVFEKR